MDRNLLSGTLASLLLHAVVGWWVMGLDVSARILPAVPEKPPIRTVREEIALPKPKPPEPPKPEEPKAELKQEAPKQEAPPKPQPKPPQARRAPQPKSAEPKAETPKPSQEPAPLVLSKTYGGGDGEGVAVQTGKDDVLGDPAVEANEENVRRRPTSDPVGAGTQAAAGPSGDAESAKVMVVLAKPKIANCEGFVTWPEGAPATGRVIKVVLLLDIGADGAVKKTRLLRGAGEPFDSEAQRDMKRCPFVPGTRDGKAIPTKVGFEVEFKPNA